MQLYNTKRKASFVSEMPKENGFLLTKMRNTHPSLSGDENKQDALLVYAAAIMSLHLRMRKLHK